MSDSYSNQAPEDEISIKDIVDFLLESWKAILATGLVGLLGAAGFIVFTPSQYEATAQIQMAQIAPNNNSNPLVVNVEDPNLLMARLKLPSSYTEDEIKACGLQDLKLPAESLANTAKLSPVKGVSSIVELKIRLESKDQAVSCAQSLFENIRDSQNNIVKPYIEEAKALLTKYQARLTEAQSLVARADKSGSALSAAYLANRDEVKFLTDESIRLNNLISAGDTRQAKLVAPIYASDIPVFPKKKISLLVGLLAGLFLGVLFVMMRKAWRGYRA
jgi:LPS O-antigen subunit length determinant protein (WzzB/FepE family)